MTALAQQLNFLLAIGTIAIQVATVVLVALLLLERYRQKTFRVLTLVGAYGIQSVFFISLVSVGISLFYSEILGFVPCGLCWFQRIFLYPQVILAGMAWYKKDNKIADYLIALSGTGALVALYQHYLQMGGSAFVPCPASGADCAQRFLFEFGYITFPLMSFTIFVLIMALMAVMKTRN
ncbi:MAG: disulfide bond formation protein B [bacterium]|nr:disulfide bond formation protein B [bacterium]